MNTPEFEQKFQEALADCGVRGGDPLLAGFSGGADSLALVLLLKKAGVGFTAIHFDHGLRGGDSRGDADWCESFCRLHSIAFERIELAVTSRRGGGESLEEAARRCRLEYWQSRAGGSPCLRVVLAHHADDALEDFFLRLARGGNASGLTGLRPYREVAGVRIIRPLLHFRKTELEAWLKCNGVSQWCHDASNDDPVFRRNAVRHQWLPPIRETLGGDQALFRTLDVLRMDADFLERVAESAVPEDDSLDDFACLHPAILPRVLRYWVERKTGSGGGLTHAVVMRLREALANPGEGVKYIPVSDTFQLALDHGRLRVAGAFPDYCLRWKWREHPKREIPGAAAVLRASLLPRAQVSAADVQSPQADRVYFPAESLPECLTVKNWAAGDRMVPFGHTSARKVKDIFSQEGIAGDCRPVYPEVSDGATVLWVAGVKRSAHFPVTADTGMVVRLDLLS